MDIPEVPDRIAKQVGAIWDEQAGNRAQWSRALMIDPDGWPIGDMARVGMGMTLIADDAVAGSAVADSCIRLSSCRRQPPLCGGS
jgi:hypothetical protein